MINEKRSGWPSGIKKTKTREYVLRVLDDAPSPLCATKIYAKIEKDRSSISLSTVYRILELLVKKDLAVKTTIMNDDKALYELNRDQHKHYALCLKCRKLVALKNCPMEQFIPKIEDNGFQVMGHKVEIYGYCHECVLRND